MIWDHEELNLILFAHYLVNISVISEGTEKKLIVVNWLALTKYIFVYRYDFSFRKYILHF